MQARKFLEWAVHWHLPFLLLILFLALHSLSTFGTFVVSDDLAWVQRTAADAYKPWNAFGKPVFGDYYRPIPNLVWLMNYYLWGFDFDGHQLMFILMWLAGVCLVYAVGCRLGGRIAGFAAASLVGLNDMYLLLASWKSWYTTLTEFVVVLAWALCFMEWLESRRRGYWIASAALAVVGLLSRELAPLIIAAAVLVSVILPAFKTPGLPRSKANGCLLRGLPAEASGAPGLPDADSAKAGFGRRRAAGWLVVWAAVTAAALLILPSYRSGARALLTNLQRALFSATQATSSAAAGGGNGVTGAYVWGRFVSHASSIFNFGISRYLVWFAALFAALRARRERAALTARYPLVLLGALVLGAVLLGIPWVFAVLGKEANAASIHYAQPVEAAILMSVFCAVALRGDRWDRMLGAWFLVSFVPVLLLEHKSGAYHLLAFTALALYTARRLPTFVEQELRPAYARLRSKALAGADNDARCILAGIFILLMLAQALMLGANARRVGPEIRMRVEYGGEMEAHVRRAVEGVLRNAAPDRRVWVAPEPYAELAGLILQDEHGFQMERLDGSSPAGLRAFDAVVRVYVRPAP